MSEAEGRYLAARPAEGAVVPVPGQPRFLEAGDRIDTWDPYWARLLADGSIVAEAQQDPAAPSPDTSPAPAPRPVKALPAADPSAS